MKHALQHIHFVGIGGSGMSGIAAMLHEQGYRVSGSDLARSEVTQQLSEQGLRVFHGHEAEHVSGAQVVVTSSAVKADNAEVLAARAQGIPVVPRAVMLAELMRHKQGLAIAGTHGKTTTTALVANLLEEADTQPSYVVGGRLNSAGTHSQLGCGPHIVVEADESDASFLHLLPVLCVVTNIDADHMSTYGHDMARLRAAFVDFIHRMPFYGPAVMCIDDPGVQSILPMLSRRVVTYGTHEEALIRATNIQALAGGGMRFVCKRQGASGALPELKVTVNLAGRHNVLNALAAIAVAAELGLPDASVLRALAGFRGVGRRFERHGNLALPASSGPGSFTLIDDYGHHPVELAAVLSAARGAFPGRRLVLAFQPHRYSRTRDCFEEFVQVLGQADVVLLCEVYGAGEAPLLDFDGQALAHAVRDAGRLSPVYAGGVEELPDCISKTVRNGDVVLTMGAGSIGELPQSLIELLGAAT